MICLDLTPAFNVCTDLRTRSRSEGIHALRGAGRICGLLTRGSLMCSDKLFVSQTARASNVRAGSEAAKATYGNAGISKLFVSSEGGDKTQWLSAQTLYSFN